MSKTKLVYDICSVPEGMTVEKIVYIWKDHNLVLWDSKNEGSVPVLIDAGDAEIALVDVSNASPERLKQIDKLIKE